jgi:transcriptional regulator with GAF, ATPase, and Fis domain
MTPQRAPRSIKMDQTDHFLLMIETLITQIGRESDRKKILGAVLPCALTTSGLEIGALLVADDEPDKMSAVVRRGMPDEIINQLTQGDLGRLLFMGQRLWIKPRPMQLGPAQALLGRHKLKCLLGIPFYFEGRTLGAIVVGSRKISSGNLGLENQQRLEVLAQLIALFLDGIRLRTMTRTQDVAHSQRLSISQLNFTNGDDLEELLAAIMSAEEEVARQNSDLGLLNDLSNQIVNNVQINTIVEAAVKRSCQALDVQASWCYLFEQGMLNLCEHQGLSERYVAEMKTLFPGNGVEGMAFCRNELIARDGALFHTGQARNLVQNEGLRIIAATPLRDENEPFGVLAVAHNRDQSWSSRDGRMLRSIAYQAERAIINARRFTEMEQKARKWETGYKDIEQTNYLLSERVKVLENQVQTLRRMERQIWNILAVDLSDAHASRSGSHTDEALAMTLKTILTAMSRKLDQIAPLQPGN